MSIIFIFFDATEATYSFSTFFKVSNLFSSILLFEKQADVNLLNRTSCVSLRFLITISISNFVLSNNRLNSLS